jgi:hypothetical protein
MYILDDDIGTYLVFEKATTRDHATQEVGSSNVSAHKSVRKKHKASTKGM